MAAVQGARPDGRDKLVATSDAHGHTGRSLKLEVERVRLLRECGLFRSCQDSEIEKMAGVASVRNFPAGSVVIRQGGEANYVFIIHSGKARVTLGVGPPAQQPEARVLSPGRYFGELALLRGGERSANVIAVDPLECLMVSRVDFLGLMNPVEVNTAHYRFAEGTSTPDVDEKEAEQRKTEETAKWNNFLKKSQRAKLRENRHLTGNKFLDDLRRQNGKLVPNDRKRRTYDSTVLLGGTPGNSPRVRG